MVLVLAVVTDINITIEVEFNTRNDLLISFGRIFRKKMMMIMLLRKSKGKQATDAKLDTYVHQFIYVQHTVARRSLPGTVQYHPLTSLLPLAPPG